MKVDILKMVLVAAVSCCMAACNDYSKEIAKASEQIKDKDYDIALKTLDGINRNTMLETDSLMCMLSTAYYGETTDPVRVAQNCSDMDIDAETGTVYFTDFDAGVVHVYDLNTMVFMKDIDPGLHSEVFSTALSPDGKYLAFAPTNRQIAIYDIAADSVVATLHGHTASVRDVVFKDKHTLFSCGNDQAVYAWFLNLGNDDDVADWPVENGAIIGRNHQHARNIKSLQLSHDGKYLLTASNDGTAGILSDHGPNLIANSTRLDHGENYVNDAAIAGDNAFAVTVSGDGMAKIWDVEYGRLLHRVDIGEVLCSVDISPDGKYILIGGGKNAYVVDSNSAAVIAKIPGKGMPIWTVKFIDNNKIAFADNAFFWCIDLLTGETLLDAAHVLAHPSKK